MSQPTPTPTSTSDSASPSESDSPPPRREPAPLRVRYKSTGEDFEVEGLDDPASPVVTFLQVMTKEHIDSKRGIILHQQRESLTYGIERLAKLDPETRAWASKAVRELEDALSAQPASGMVIEALRGANDRLQEVVTSLTETLRSQSSDTLETAGETLNVVQGLQDRIVELEAELEAAPSGADSAESPGSNESEASDGV